MHLGLIVGVGPAATEFYYRRLVDHHAGTGVAPELTIANARRSIIDSAEVHIDDLCGLTLEDNP